MSYDIRLERHLDVAPEVAFHHWVDAEARRNWYRGDEDDWAVEADTDLRVGGRVRRPLGSHERRRLRGRRNLRGRRTTAPPRVHEPVHAEDRRGRRAIRATSCRHLRGRWRRHAAPAHRTRLPNHRDARRLLARGCGTRPRLLRANTPDTDLHTRGRRTSRESRHRRRRSEACIQTVDRLTMSPERRFSWRFADPSAACSASFCACRRCSAPGLARRRRTQVQLFIRARRPPTFCVRLRRDHRTTAGRFEHRLS